MIHHNHTQRGFALLMTLLVISVVVSVGLTILDVTIKQVRLSGGARDSEVAFHAANAGVECARYWRNKEFGAMEVGNPVNLNCFGATPIQVVANTTLPANVYHYQYEFTADSLGGGDKRCSQIDTVIINASNEAPGTKITFNTSSIIPGYPKSNTVCDAGGICTIISSRGYNRQCPGNAGTFPPGTIQREVLLEL